MAETNGKDLYLETFARMEPALAGNGGAWLAPARKRAIGAFADLGFPTTRDEAWRYTNVQPIASTQFEIPAGYHKDALTPEIFERLTFEPWQCSHLVFMNGRFVPELGTLRSLPPGVIVKSLAQALSEDRAAIEPHLARYADSQGQAFAALNTAFFQDGVYVGVPKGATFEEPIHILFVTTPNGEKAMSHPRNLFVIGEDARLTIVESYAGIGAGVYFTNAVTEVVAGDGAVIDHYKLQRESEEAFHVATLEARLGRGSSFSSHSVSLGGALVRNDVNAVLGAEGADCILNGLYVLDGRQHVDNHTLIDHARPRGSSRELYKGVLDGASRGVFDGTIVVRPDAQKTDARQVNRNLLLSDEALADSKPTLQIHADDVKCSHAATIGQLQEDAMFYLRSRALSEETARSLLIQAFVSDIVGRIKIEPVRTGLECLLFTRLPRHHGPREAS